MCLNSMSLHNIYGPRSDKTDLMAIKVKNCYFYTEGKINLVYYFGFENENGDIFLLDGHI